MVTFCIVIGETHHNICTVLGEEEQLIIGIELSCCVRLINFSCLGVAEGQEDCAESSGEENYVGIERLYCIVQSLACRKHCAQTAEQAADRIARPFRKWNIKFYEPYVFVESIGQGALVAIHRNKSYIMAILCGKGVCLFTYNTFYAAW